MSGKRKNFSSRARPHINPTEACAAKEECLSWVIEFPENFSGVRKYDFGQFMGKGFDDVVKACYRVVDDIIRVGSVRVMTAVQYARSGAGTFFAFLAEYHGGGKLTLDDVDVALVEQFLTWLRLRGKVPNSGRAEYQHLKAILLVLVRRGMIPGGKGIFPRNPYPQSNKKSQGERQVSAAEKQRIAVVLKQDLIAIGKQQFEGTGLEAMAIMILAIALRRGLSTQETLDLAVDCLKPHPLVKGQYLMTSVKHRAKAVKQRPTRESTRDEQESHAAGDVAAIIHFVTRTTESIRAGAPVSIRNTLWLCVSEARQNAGKILAVNKGHLAAAIRKFVDRHDLRGDDGKRLRLNLSRLRKTLGNGAWRLSNGDIREVASSLKNTPRVADDHYVEVTPEMERNHVFLGRALLAKWRSEDGFGSEVSVTNTPLGACADPYYGDRAPADGEACIDFLSCFKCKSQILVEDPRDLHRLFSFYFFLDGERFQMGDADWNKRFGWILRLIDEVTALRFAPEIVSEARRKGKEAPITFWRNFKRAGVKPYAA
ncbi:phage integrase SAM-like domain-containing protein [Cupriavidus basilensis]|uniref:phage integrase SAM-like domain-containing protein n=1 Tax=Cupriavidus basilensis TaxID=68895 RepID=UPI0023E7B95F|nr:phage integrase SAM-like domain-containing protein [Cupriavidus basilensis]MDF3883054.1 phage integrase SAM-like domain-containing protein [Cupriavidus basilensis]